MINNTGYILELNNVKKVLPGTGFCLYGLSFAVPYGTIMGFVGENGAGKTTTIGCILNTLRIDSGEIKIFGKNHIDCEERIRERIEVVFDSNTFSKSLTARNISVVMKNIYKQWNEKMFDDYLEQFALPVRDDVLDILLNFIQDEKHSVFLSSHILSDLEKISDYITFIHKGKILISVSNEEITNNFGIILALKF